MHRLRYIKQCVWDFVYFGKIVFVFDKTFYARSRATCAQAELLNFIFQFGREYIVLRFEKFNEFHTCGCRLLSILIARKQLLMYFGYLFHGKMKMILTVTLSHSYLITQN